MKGDSAKCRHETTSYAALYMNVPRCALGICIVIKLSPPSLIRQHRRIPSRRQSASRLPSPRRTTNTPFRAISSERERERGRARSGWGCVTPCLPLTDGRTGAALFDSRNHHIVSRSKSLLVLAAPKLPPVSLHIQMPWSPGERFFLSSMVNFCRG